MTNNEGERIASLEARMVASEKRDEEIIEKLDSLLALKNKGMGAFWLASIIIGGVFTGLVTLVSDWIK